MLKNKMKLLNQEQSGELNPKNASISSTEKHLREENIQHILDEKASDLESSLIMV